MHTVYRLINSTFDLKNLSLRLSRLAAQIMGAEYCSIVLIDGTRKYSYLRAVTTKKRKNLITKRTLITNRIELKIINSGNAVRNGIFIGIPLISEEVIGLLMVRRKKRMPPFDNFDLEMLINICSQAVMAIRNLQLYEEQENLILGTIKSLVELMDIKGRRTYTHTSKFLRLVLAIARQMNLNERQMCSLEYATLLHDAGKVDIPVEILAKPTKLTCQEFDIVKNHPLKGVKIIKHLQVLRPALPIIMYHHEKYDGTGYPSGLKKGQIPLGARIMAVADAFEAMIFYRPYRERISINEALQEIKNNSGSQFDPKVVEALVQVSKKSKKYLQLK